MNNENRGDQYLNRSKTLYKTNENRRFNEKFVGNSNDRLKTIERTPKLKTSKKSTPSIPHTHHNPSKSFSKGKNLMFKNMIGVGVKIAYKTGMKQFNSREVYKPRQFNIDKQKINSSTFNRKSFMENEIRITRVSPLKEAGTDKDKPEIDNHVTKFSFATKAGKSIKNPRK